MSLGEEPKRSSSFFSNESLDDIEFSEELNDQEKDLNSIAASPKLILSSSFFASKQLMIP